MQQCGFCSMLSGLFRRAMCVASRRGSSESYYRELGDQETLKIDEQSVVSSEEIVEINQPKKVLEELEELEEPDIDVMARRHISTGRFLTMHKRRKKHLLTRTLSHEVALLDDLQLGQVQCILEQSGLWRFNAFTLENVSGGRSLPVLCVHLFHVYGLIPHFKLDVANAWKLFTLIEEGYHSTNPYHNSMHAADVTQAMHCFLQQNRIREYLEPLEIMASLLAAVAHDMDHPGVNQPFLIATSNHLASLYQNTSVLENHHWRSAISCLIESGFLDTCDVRATLERQISSLILATDITRQQEYLGRFKNLLDTETLDLSNPDHRHLVLQIALKCADISNPCRPWEISRKWSLKVCEEFFRQGDYERKLNLPVTALCDRQNTTVPKIQIGFFKFVATPLIAEWHKFLQNDLSSQMINNLKYNQKKWETLVAQELAEEIRTETSDAEVVADDVEIGSETNLSESSEMLLPLRRSSFNPPKPTSFKEQLRRFSVPLNMFQRDKSYTSLSLIEIEGNEDTSVKGSLTSIQSQQSITGKCSCDEKVLSTENLLPNSSIASITTPVQASRLKTVLKGGRTFKLVRQKTFPPMEYSGQVHALLCRPLYTSAEGTIYSANTHRNEWELLRDDKFKTDNLFTSNVEIQGGDNKEKENVNMPHRGSKWCLGSQLRENLTSVNLGLFPAEDHLGRRKSMPADDLCAPKEKIMREVVAVIPELLRALAGNDSSSRRRGSAPAPISPSELPGLAALAGTKSNNNPRRKLTVTAQIWKTKANETSPHLVRRSSLPVEVMTEISSR
ncbi:uncharacterized protein LOC126979034 isoform X3 [Leptidea sinapis]|uniref:uncharacterized protein LOC126979034 isoform X3 n=1 Tax=Leptidea sinapis TaxID=189913 RepID=UPI0021C2DE1C|nr:uncharacterized protein LOC126979034 isoform X3 [Leptidea sinapis]